MKKNIKQKLLYITVTLTTIISLNTAYASDDAPLDECIAYEEENEIDYKTILNELYSTTSDIENEDTAEINREIVLNSIEKIFINVNSNDGMVDKRIKTENQEDLIRKLRKFHNREIDINILVKAIEKVLLNIEDIEKHDQLKQKREARFIKNRDTLIDRYTKYCNNSFADDKYFQKTRDCLEEDRGQYYHYPYGKDEDYIGRYAIYLPTNYLQVKNARKY